MRRLSTAAVAFALLLSSCGDDDEASSTPEQATEPDEAARRDRPGLPQTEVEVHYDLHRHLARAELWEGEALVVDFGVPRGHQHTLGRWQTQLGADHALEGTSVVVIPRTVGRFLLPRLGDGAFDVKIRARAFADGRTTVYLDEETIAHVTLPTDGGYAIVEASLPEGALAQGERFLQLRVASAGTAPGVGRAGVAVDWMRIGPVGAPLSDEAPAAASAMVDEAGRLALPDGVAASWTLEVPDGGALSARARGAGSAQVRVEVDGGGGARRETLRFEDDETARVDLSGHAGEVVRIALEAEGELTFDELAVVTPGASDVRPRPPAPANVVVYLVDTLRADKLRIYDPETRVRTPGLSSWVEEGAAIFRAGHSQENWTKPSVATLLSGLMPWEHDATADDAVLPGSVSLLSEILRADGFHTGAFIANGYVSDKFGFRQGFDSFRNYIREGRRTQARFVAADVLSWLDDRPEDQPFFLYVHTIDPHVPYMPPDDVLASYDPDPYDGPVDFSRDRELLEKIKSGALRVNDRDKRRLEALYDGEITYHDVHFAAILEGLARRDLEDDTLVVFTSDHGEELFDHGSVGHGHTVYEELLQVPLVVRIPGLTSEASGIDDAAGLVDVAPTILDALRKPIPDEMSGRSLLPLLRGESATAPRATVSGFMNGWRTIVVGRYKLIQRTASRMMLYDLETDPGETNDLAAERPLTVRYLRGLLGLVLAGAHHVHEAERTEIDAETEAQLRALGYVGTSRPE